MTRSSTAGTEHAVQLRCKSQLGIMQYDLSTSLRHYHNSPQVQGKSYLGCSTEHKLGEVETAVFGERDLSHGVEAFHSRLWGKAN